MTEEEIEKQAETECKKLLQSEKGYNGISFQEFWTYGAKWGMEHATKWHDLREDPTDLPKEKGEYRVYFYDSELKANRNVNWYYYGKSWGCRLDVIAWCELPQFKE